MNEYSEIMSTEFKENSESVGNYDVPKTLANHLCEILTKDGHDTNWGYSGGWVCVQTKGDVRKVKELFEFYAYFYRKFAEEKLYEGIPKIIVRKE